MKECILSLGAIIVIGLIIGYALSLGHDGGLVQLAIAAIAGLAGYQIARRPGNGGTKGGTPGAPTSTPGS